jgi:hypothetical protein
LGSTPSFSSCNIASLKQASRNEYLLSLAATTALSWPFSFSFVSSWPFIQAVFGWFFSCISPSPRPFTALKKERRCAAQYASGQACTPPPTLNHSPSQFPFLGSQTSLGMTEMIVAPIFFMAVSWAVPLSFPGPWGPMC